MLAQSVRATRQSLVRALRSQNAFVSSRSFTVSTATRADIVQDIYLKELKGFKPTPIKASDSEGVVQKFKAPAAPALPADIDVAKELKEYETQQPEVEGQAEAGAAPADQDWFEPHAEDEPAHH